MFGLKKWGFVVFMTCLESALSFTLLEDIAEDQANDQFFLIDDNEDAKLNFTGLTAKYGYATEEHMVITKDGYILTIFHFLEGKKCNGSIKPTPVVLQHGLLDSSDTFIVARPSVGLAYILADACYDVWCSNHRGNQYSKHHVTWDNDSRNYWNFTFDEHGMFDLPAIVDYILIETRSEEINYIGHSQGTTDLFILLSTLTEYNAKFKKEICLAPVAWLKHMFSPTLQALAKTSPALMFGNDFVGPTEISRRNVVADVFLNFVCSLVPETLCGQILFVITGLNPKTIDRDTLSTAFGHFPTATSSNNLIHFAQAVNIDKFRRYNYGEKTNLKVYGTAEPPDYDVSKVSAPVALLTGQKDFLVSEKDVNTLKSKLPNVVDHYVIPQKDWSHFNFVWGKSIPELLAPKVFNYLEMYG